MKKFTIGLAVFAASICASHANAGRWEVTEDHPSALSVHYTGTVDRYDVFFWNSIVEQAGNRVILLTIDSGGGSAFAGIKLYWALEAHPRLVTTAGDCGCWSAAALMWLAGDHQIIKEHSAVWFHAAYCVWDPTPPVNIGCDTKLFQAHLALVFTNAGFNGPAFNAWLNVIQEAHGTDGWIGVTYKDGWQVRDTTDWWFEPFDVEWIK